MPFIRKSALVIFGLSGFILIFFITSTYMYQILVNEGSIIADKQCMNVNPLIIQRRNSYIQTLKIAQANGSEKEYWAEQMHYLDLAKQSVKAQGEWLQEEKKYMSRWDFRLIIPANIQTAAQIQYKSREADMKSTNAVVDLFNAPGDLNKQDELTKTIINLTKIQDDADAEFERIWQSKPSFDLRTRFIKVPLSKCPKENMRIPSVMDIFAPPKSINNGPVS